MGKKKGVNSGEPLLVTAEEVDGKVQLCCFRITPSGKKKLLAAASYTWDGLSAGYAVFVSLIFAALTAERNKHNLGLQVAGAGSSFAANAPMSFIFASNIPAFFKKMASLGWTYRISAASGFLLSSMTTFAGLKLGMDAIFGNQYDFVKSVSWSGVGAFSFNTFSTRLIGGTELINRLIVFAQRLMFKEYIKYQALFNLLDDLKTYGPTLTSTDFHYLLAENRPISELARNFYQALADKRVKPIPANGQRALNALSLALGAVTTWITYALIPLWLYIAENGLNACATLFNSKSAWGTDMPWLTWLSAMSSELFYLNYATQVSEILVDLVSLPLRKALYADLRWPSKTALIVSTTVVLTGALAVIGYLSGGGMEKEQNDAQAIDYGSVANSTFVQTPLSGPTIPFEPVIGMLTGAIAGNLMNVGSALIGLISKTFRSGTVIWPGETGGVNDAIGLVEKILKYRQYQLLAEQTAHEKENSIVCDRTIEGELRDIAASRSGIFKATTLDWGFFTKKKIAEGTHSDPEALGLLETGDRGSIQERGL